MREAEQLNLDPLVVGYAPETVVPVEDRSGPIVVTVEYKIHECDVPEFLRAMAERRRIRRRDGARQWTLLRDLADAETWIERYSVPTWIDYIRHNSRLTQEDADVPARLRALHRGSDPPVVQRMIERPPDSTTNGGPTSPHKATEPLMDSSRPF